MGGGLSRVFSILGSSKKEQRIVMVGLDNAGKTTILYQVKMGEVVQTTPTIGECSVVFLVLQSGRTVGLW